MKAVPKGRINGSFKPVSSVLHEKPVAVQIESENGCRPRVLPLELGAVFRMLQYSSFMCFCLRTVIGRYLL